MGFQASYCKIQSQDSRRDRIIQNLSLKSRKDKQNVSRQFWHGLWGCGCVCFHMPLLLFLMDWAKSGSQTMQFNFTMCAQSFVLSPECSESPMGRTARHSPAVWVSTSPGFACLYPTCREMERFARKHMAIT